MFHMRFLFSLVLLLLADHAGAESCIKALSGLSRHELHIHLAEQAGLNYIDEPQIGYSREKKKDSFQYFDSKHRLVKNAQVLDRIEKLNIPPGWENVWISADLWSHIQATGEDEQGRLQSLYHELWKAEVRDATKFERMQRFGKALPDLREAVQHDLNRNSGSESKNEDTRLAAVVRLLEISGIRIGGEKYAEENKHYGLTTLLVRHVVKIEKDSLTFKFIGKKGKAYEVVIIDRAVVRLVRQLVKNKKRQDLLFDVSAKAVNDYIKKNAQRKVRSADFSAKDFRTWVASVTAAKVLSETEWSKDEKHQDAAIKAASVAASELLRNTWVVARNSYIDPFIFESYRSGALHRGFRTADLSSHSLEAAFLRLLQKKQ